MKEKLMSILAEVIDVVYRSIPRKKPSQNALQQCKIVSHRGERDNQIVFENTILAYEALIDTNVWGIEFDIRWTKDLVPVIIHDLDTKRVFNQDIIISKVTANELKIASPLIPTLAEFLQYFKKRFHLMIELKKEDHPNIEKQRDTLKQLLADYEPIKDFHILLLDKEVYNDFPIFPKETYLLVGLGRLEHLVQYSLQYNFAGVAGYFLFMTNDLVKKLHAAKQISGAGFLASKNSLYRELNRNIDFIFTNDAKFIDSQRS